MPWQRYAVGCVCNDTRLEKLLLHVSDALCVVALSPLSADVLCVMPAGEAAGGAQRYAPAGEAGRDGCADRLRRDGVRGGYVCGDHVCLLHHAQGESFVCFVLCIGPGLQ